MSRFEPPDFFHSFTATSIGGIACAQYWVDLATWEGVLNANPQVNGIVELGTFKGGFSYYLEMQSRARGYRWFITYDVNVPEREIPGFSKMDIYREADTIGNYLGACGPIALFCDGGNKPRELRTFPPMCHPESIFAVHDWGTEMLPADVPDFLEPIYEDYLDRLGSVTRWFRMRE